MLNFYISYKSLNKIFYSKDNDDRWWADVFTHLKEIYLILDDGQKIEDLETDESTSVYHYSMDNQVCFFDKSDFISDIIVENSKVLEDPHGVFLLDIEETVADKIQTNYGVICQSTSKLDNNCGLFAHRTYNCIKKEPGSWKKVFEKTITLPINSCILIDRYFFTNDYKKRNSDGYRNLGDYNFEKFIETNSKNLSTKANTDFLIIFNTKVFNGSFCKLSNSINETKKNILNNRYIDLNLLGISNCPETHNRLILSNYYIVKADHKLASFKDEECCETQQITVTGLLSEIGDNGLYVQDDYHTHYLNIFNDIIINLKKDNHKYSKNGNIDVSIDDFSHRLFMGCKSGK